MRHHEHPEIKRLVDRQAVTDTVIQLFVEVDRKDWPVVAMLLAGSVKIDMSTVGGPKEEMTGKAIADLWAQGLDPVKAVHHQLGNILVDVEGDEATVFCYGTTTHYRPDTDKPMTTLAGSYDLHLVRHGGRWRVDVFTYHSKFVV